MLNLPQQDNYAKFIKSVTSRKDASVYCKMCQKMDFHCERCRYRCHKKCQGHTHQCSRKWTKRSSSFNRIRTGDDHWTKVLQANDLDIPSCPRHCSSLVSSPRSATDKEFSSIFLNFGHSGHSNSSSVSRGSSFASHHPGQKPQQSPTSPTSSSLSSAKDQFQIGSKEKNLFHALYSRFVNWIESNKMDNDKQSTGMTNPAKTSYNENDFKHTSPSIGCVGFPSGESVRYRLKDRRRLKKRPKTIAATSLNLSSSESEFDKTSTRTEVDYKVTRWRRENMRLSSTCSSAVSPCTSPVTSDWHPWCSNEAGSTSMCRSEESDFRSSKKRSGFQFPLKRNQDRVTTESASNVSSSLESETSISSLSSQKSPEPNVPSHELDSKRASFRAKPTLRSTSIAWKSKDTLVNSSIEKDSLDVSDGASICTILDNCEPYLRDALKDWTISFCDIKLKETLSQGSLYTLHKGQWHGDILVYLYHSISETKVPCFLREVSRLSKIRHENICLFMGACFNNNNMAVVTSELKGMSVYEKLHLSMDRMPSRTRVNIAKYVAQAMGYLHARNLVAITLNTRNVYFEPKVKLSLIDQSNNLPAHLPKCCGLYFARGVLGYFSPEILKKLKFSSVDNNDDELHTFQTDSYAFGTLLYELLSCHLPMKGFNDEELIWQVCNGKRQNLSLLGCNPVLKILIEKCWSQDPKSRPTFIDINEELLQKTGLHKRHSSSQPERLDQRGSFSFSTKPDLRRI